MVWPPERNPTRGSEEEVMVMKALFILLAIMIGLAILVIVRMIAYEVAGRPDLF